MTHTALLLEERQQPGQMRVVRYAQDRPAVPGLIDQADVCHPREMVRQGR